MACDILYRNKRISEETLKNTIASKLKERFVQTPTLDRDTTLLLDRLKKRTGVDYQLYNSNLDSRAGYTVSRDGKPLVYLNTNKIRKDTPIHEYFHIFLESVLTDNPVLLTNIKTLIDSIDNKGNLESFERKIIELKEELLTNPTGKYGSTILNDLGYKEILTEIVGRQATERLKVPITTASGNSVRNFIKTVIDKITTLIKEVLGLPKKSKFTITSNSTIQDISNYFSDEVINGTDSFSYLQNTKIQGVLEQDAKQGKKPEEAEIYKGDASKAYQDADSNTSKLLNKFFTRDMEVSQDMLDNIKNFDIDDSSSKNKTNKITVENTMAGPDKTTPGWRLSYYTAYGKRISLEFTERQKLDTKLQEVKDELLKEIPEASKTFGQRMVKFFNDVSDAAGQGKSITKLLEDIPNNLDMTFINTTLAGQDGNILKGKFYTYSDFIAKFGPSYKIDGMDDNIIIFKKEGMPKYTIFSLATIPSEMSGPKVTNSFGVDLFTSNKQAIQEGLTLNKTLKTRRTLLAGLLALKIKEVDPSADFHSFRYFDQFNPQNSLTVVDIEEVVTNLKSFSAKLESLPNTDKEIKEVKDLFNDIKPLVDGSDKVEIDYVESLFGHLNRTYTDQNRTTVYYDELLAFSTGKMDEEPNMKRQLAGAIENKLFTLKHIYPSDYLDRRTAPGKEFFLLTQAFLQLKSVEFGIDMRTINSDMTMDLYDQWVKGQGDHFRPELVFFFNRIGREMNAIKELYREGYMKRKNRAFEEYFRNSTLTTKQKTEEALFNVQESKYDNLFKKQVAFKYDELKDTYKLDRQGNKIQVEVHSMELKNLDDASLEAHEKKIIASTAEEISKATETVFLSRLDAGMLNKELELEGKKVHNLTKEEKQEFFYKWEEKNFGVERDAGKQLTNIGNYRFLPGMKRSFLATLSEGKGINKFAEALKNWYDSSYDVENATLHVKDPMTGTSTMGMLEQFKLGKEKNRLPSLGLKELADGTIVVTDSAMNQSISKNLQASSDFYVFKLLKVSKDKQLGAIYHAARGAILANKVQKDAENSLEMKTLDGMFKLLVHNKMQDLKLGRGGFTDGNKIISKGTGITSVAMLSVNIGAGFAAYMGAHGAAFTAALSKQYGNKLFGLKDLMSAHAFVMNPKNMSFVSQLVDLLGLTNNDETQLIFNQNIKAGTSGIGMLKGIAAGRQGMALMGLGDLTAKATMAIAQLKHDGIFENFAFDEHKNMYYDWDKEFRNPSKNPDRSSIVEGVLEELEEDGRYKNAKGNFIVPYSNTMFRTLDTITGQLFGPFADTQKGFYQTNALAKGAAQFKSYVVARLNRFISKGAVNTNISWMERDTDGTITKKFLYQQGFLNTALYYIEQVMATKDPIRAWREMRPEQRKNIVKLGIDLSVMAAAYIAYYSFEWLDEDDEFKWKQVNPWHYHTESAIFDFVGVYNPKDYLEAVATPVSIVYAQRLATSLYRSFDWDFAAGMQSTTQSLILTTGAGKSIDKLFQVGSSIADLDDTVSPFR